MMWRRPWIYLAILACLVVLIYFALNAYYLVAANGLVDTEWGQLNSAYHERTAIVAPLIGQLRTIALYDRSDYDALRSAEADAQRLAPSGREAVTVDPKAFADYVDVQRRLTAAMYTMIGLGRRDATLKYDDGFIDMQNELDKTSADIERAKKRYDSAARTFDDERKAWPDDMIGKLLGHSYDLKGTFAERHAKKPRAGG